MDLKKENILMKKFPFPLDFRIESGSGGDSEVQRTMLELLNQLDGFEATKNIKVIMATNRIDILDSALLRPGRIDRKIEFPPPNEEARLDILKIHSRKMNLTRGINLRKIAEMMPGSSGAEVSFIFLCLPMPRRCGSVGKASFKRTRGGETLLAWVQIPAAA